MVEKIVWFFFPFVFISLCCIFFSFFVIVDFCFIFYKTLALKDSNTIQTAPPVPTPGAPAELGVPLAFFFFFLNFFSFVAVFLCPFPGLWCWRAGGGVCWGRRNLYSSYMEKMVTGKAT